MRTLPAAAVQKGDAIRLNDEDVTVVKVENSTPAPGRITWTSTSDGRYEVGASLLVEVVKLA